MSACDEVRLQLSALLDGELPDDDAAGVRQHLAHCPSCEQEWQTLGSLDRRLKEILVIDDVEAQVAKISVAHHASRGVVAERKMRHAFLFAIVIAASILVIVVGLQGRKDRPIVAKPQIEPQIEPQSEPQSETQSETQSRPIAKLVRATAPMEMLSPESERWIRIDPSKSHEITDGTRVRTLDAVCEITMDNQTKIRLDQKAEVVVGDPQWRLETGRLWCRAATQEPVAVSASLDDSKPTNLLNFACPSSSEFQCNSNRESVTIESLATGNSETSCAYGAQTIAVKARECVTIAKVPSSDRVAVERKSVSSTAKVWQLPLLALNDGSESELMNALKELLAPIGMTKARHLNEQQLRSLGPRGAIPLLAYVLAESSPQQLRQRRSAISVAADVADHTAIGLLRELETDSDEYISSRAKSALERIASEVQ